MDLPANPLDSRVAEAKEIFRNPWFILATGFLLAPKFSDSPYLTRVKKPFSLGKMFLDHEAQRTPGGLIERRDGYGFRKVV